jgi:hypothetical protein
MTPEMQQVLELREKKADEFNDPKRNRTAKDADRLEGAIQVLDEVLVILGHW